MAAGCLAFAYLSFNPIMISESFGKLEPILVSLPLSFIFWVIGSKIGKDTEINKKQ